MCLFGRFKINVYICSTISKGTYRLVVLTPQTRRIKLFQHESFERRRKEAVLLADGNSHPQFIVLVYYSATFCSWGVSERIATWYDNKPSLEIKVQGMLHKGSVLVSYNEGVDVFEVRLLNPQRVVVKTLEQVFADELGTRIDELVERPAGMSDDEYRQKAWADSVGKMIAAQ